MSVEVLAGRAPDADTRDAVAALLGPADAGALRFSPIDGGVSADVWRVRDGERSWVAKRARPRLAVAGEWIVDPRRSSVEVRFLRAAAALIPGAVPTVRGEDPDRHLFLMDDLPPPRWRLWKTLLLDGELDPAPAARLGELVGTLQARAAEADAADAFEDRSLFDALRTAPFLGAIAAAHPDLRAQIDLLAMELDASPGTLVHGDVSPKNLLVADDGAVVLLDAECATRGAAHFDLAFPLAHLMLKWARVADTAAPEPWRALLDALVDGWRRGAGAARDAATERRAAALLPALLLARVDGLSPVDYLSVPLQARVRSFARTQLRVHPDALDLLFQRWTRAMDDPDR